MGISGTFWHGNGNNISYDSGTAESLTISGRVASIMVAGKSLGSVIQPQIVGRLFDEPAAGGPMSLVYVLVTASLVHVVLFAFMWVFVSRCLHDHPPSRRV